MSETLQIESLARALYETRTEAGRLTDLDLGMYDDDGTFHSDAMTAWEDYGHQETFRVQARLLFERIMR